MKRGKPSRQANLWVARIIPVFLLAIVIYSTWVVTDQICVKYLLHPDLSTLVQPRPGVAIAILVIYYLLLIPFFVCYGRMIQNIVANPGYTPRSASWHARRTSRNVIKETGQLQRSRQRSRSRSTQEKEKPSRSSESSFDNPVDSYGNPRIQDFWHKDVFVCNYDGRPPFCSSCLNWKSDRTHHCSEVDRCVRKMDHFCPWVGGVLSETSMKFFIQFLGYATLLTTHTLVFTAYLFAERVRNTHFINIHWILVLAFAALFSLFSLGMFISSMQFACLNVTTIENFSRSSKVWYLCVHIPRPDEVFARLDAQRKMVPRTIPYPRPAEENALILQNALDKQTAPESNLASKMPKSQNETQNPAEQRPEQQQQQSRLFAILELPPGSNPWDIGPVQNACEVLGHRWLDWVLPIRHSPCASHSDPESMFRLGPVVEKAKRAAGLIDVDAEVNDGEERVKEKENRQEPKVLGKKRRRRRRTSRVDTEKESNSRGKRSRQNSTKRNANGQQFDHDERRDQASR